VYESTTEVAGSLVGNYESIEAGIVRKDIFENLLNGCLWRATRVVLSGKK
jgi:hypothetical protein